jgi:acyl-CoA synthetase (AMP-forming)/AMP-acid ligase II
MRLVDGDNLDADRGELQMDCPALMPGYHKLPAKTAEVITEDGYYKTGDILRRDAQGFHYFVDRVDDMFVCNGENVFPVEVEKLLESHPAIKQACVVPVEDEVRGAMPVAFVVVADGERLDANMVKQHALASGPAYQHPRHVWLLDDLPLASTNKLDRKTLAADATKRLAG